MGELYLALSGAPGMEKLCVIKKVLPELGLTSPENVQRFRDEAAVVVRLSHGNLVPVFDAGRTDGQVYLAMDFVDGKDLLATWNRCAERGVPFPIEVAVHIVKELARGLGYAHAFDGLNLVHRDVSPANVLLSYSGEVRLTDFGLAVSSLKQQRTAPGIIFGKLSYLAPEQARSGTLDARTDIYSAGILLWELLTGQQLFPAQPSAAMREGTAAALEQVRDPFVEPPSALTSRVPLELDRITLRALAPDPAHRYQNAEELRADLAAYLAKTAPKTDAERLARFMRDLFGADIDAERKERERLTRQASNWLSGAIDVARPAAAAAPTGSGGARRAKTPPAPGAAPPPPTSAPRNPPAAATPAGGGSGEKDPRIGTTIGERYYLRRLCGEGAMGRVYEAQHIDIGKRVAIKILQSSFRHTPDIVERFRHEARAASKIGHRNIVDVTDSGMASDGAFFFVMEYLDGVNLEELINKEGVLPPPRAILIAAQICRALQAAHAADIIHRDLKPANVMLVNRKDEEDFVKVLDFGISKSLQIHESKGTGAGGRRVGALTGPDVAVGTPAYMSPEQAAGVATDGRTDIYAVGGLLYEMLSGCPPCDGDNVLAILKRKASEDPVPLRELRSDVPTDVEAVIMRALSRFPEDRQQSMRALKDELLACLAGLQGTPEPSDPRRAARGDSGPTMRVRPTGVQAWMVGVAGAAFLGGIGVWGFTHPGSSLRAAGPAEPATTRVSGAAPVVTPVPAPTRAPDVTPAAAAQPSTKTSMKASSKPRTPTEILAPAADRTRPASSPGGTGALVRAGLRPASATPAPGATALKAGADAPAHRAATAGSDGTPASAAPAAAAPASEPSALSLAEAAFNRGSYAEAVRRARQALAAAPSAAAHLLLGDVYYRTERYAEAVDEYQAALRLDPGNNLARRGVERASKRPDPTAAPGP